MCSKNNDKTNTLTHISVNGINKYKASKIKNEFAEYFSKIGKNLANVTPNSVTDISTYLNKIPINNKSIFLSPCTSFKITIIVSSLKPKASSGYDRITNILLKELIGMIVIPLEIVFNQSLELGVFPQAMKLAEVVPLYKKGSPHLIENYRPISLLITLSKILEKIIYSCVYTFLNETGQLYNSQYGFRSNHSCEHASSELVGNIVRKRELGEHTMSVYQDLLKAFDTLEHCTLFNKLEIYGIRGTALNWFKTYLSERTLKAKCNVHSTIESSCEKRITFGTPQGSCLGPLLFLIFCNDLHLNLELTSCILFADDTTIYNSHRDIKYLTWTLEHDLNIINDWFRANKLTLNTLKSVCILFKANAKVKTPDSLHLGDSPLKFVKNTKFLGVWIDQNMNWQTHCNKLVLKLQRNSHLLLRTKCHLSIHAKKVLYFAQIYSHLSYGLSIWGPMAPKKVLTTLTNIQIKCLKCITPHLKGQFLLVEDIIKIRTCEIWMESNKSLTSLCSTEMCSNESIW